MDIPAKLMQFRYPLAITIGVTMITVSIFYVAPQFLNILAYFWPLFLSTSIFLVSILIFGGEISTSSGIESQGEKTGEGLLDYVAGERPQQVEDHHNS